MYYVIKQQFSSPIHHFIGFVVEKYIASKNNEHVIFEFHKDGKVNSKVDRKWVKKKDIILLTENKSFFIQMLNKLKATEDAQQELVNQAKEQLEESMENFTNVMHEEIDKLQELKVSGDVPCILKDF